MKCARVKYDSGLIELTAWLQATDIVSIVAMTEIDGSLVIIYT